MCMYEIKSKELVLENLGNDDNISDNPFTSLEKLRKYLAMKNPMLPVFYVNTINYFGEGLIEKDKSEKILIMQSGRKLDAYLQNENGLIDYWVLTV